MSDEAPYQPQGGIPPPPDVPDEPAVATPAPAVPSVAPSAPFPADGGDAFGHRATPTARARPRTAPGNAEYDLEEYRRTLDRFSPRVARLSLGVIGLTGTASVVGLLTAWIDQAVLGVVTGVLAAVATGLESWRSRRGLDRVVAAYRIAYVELGNELDCFANGVGDYATLTDQGRRALLTERLGRINRACEAAQSG